ncbi:hypothetical protein [Acinetobacter sp. ANC 5502]
MKNRRYKNKEEITVFPLLSDFTCELSPSSSLPITILYEERRIAMMLNIASFVRVCCMKNELAATVKQSNDLSGFFYYLDWFRPFISVFDNLMEIDRNEFESFRVCEEILCFFRAIDQLENVVRLQGLFEMQQAQKLDYIQTRAKQLNTFIQLIREQMESAEVKSVIQNRVKNCESNLKSCRGLIDGCFNIWGKLLVLRIDFGFKVPEEFLSPNYYHDELKHAFNSLNNLMFLKEQMSRFLNNRRHHKVLNKIKGYILKFEHGIKKGFHCHAIFILDGNKHAKDGYFATELTKYWEQLTTGQGCTYNCHMAKQKYKNLGIGMILHTDIDKRNVLDNCLQYLCKQDQYFIFSPLKGIKTIQISQIPKLRSNSGRPRKMKVVNTATMTKAESGVKVNAD